MPPDTSTPRIPIDESRDWFCTKEVASLLGVSESTVIRYAHEGSFGASQFVKGGSWRFPRERVMKYLAAIRN